MRLRSLDVSSAIAATSSINSLSVPARRRIDSVRIVTAVIGVVRSCEIARSSDV